MKIETYERAVYEHNPLAEVLCQIRFDAASDLSDAEKTSLRERLSAIGFPNFHEERTISFSQNLTVDGFKGETQLAPMSKLPDVMVLQSVSADRRWRASRGPNFLALACSKYSNWGDFLLRMKEVTSAILAPYDGITPIRVGLRYRDVIERESIGLTGVPWHELIKPFLLGPLIPNSLAEGQVVSDADVGGYMSRVQLQLEGAKLQLQSALLRSKDGKKRAFLVDSDFFTDRGIERCDIRSHSTVEKLLEPLHLNAGALFRRAITDRLHDALRPRD
jgi:uncharacterized protein (TIGR04255 family)